MSLCLRFWWRKETSNAPMPFPKYFQEDLWDIFDSLADSSIPVLTAKAVTHATDVLLICPDRITVLLPEGNKIIIQQFLSPEGPLTPGSVSRWLHATASLQLRLLAFLIDNY